MWIKKFFDMGGVEWGWFELGFCLLRVGGLKYVVKVYYLKLIKKMCRVGGGGLDCFFFILLD